jgi:hypothetical protein
VAAEWRGEMGCPACLSTIAASCSCSGCWSSSLRSSSCRGRRLWSESTGTLREDTCALRAGDGDLQGEGDRDAAGETDANVLNFCRPKRALKARVNRFEPTIHGSGALR